MIVIINGAPESGKDTFCQMCQEILGCEYCINISTVDFIKQFLRQCGWDGVKDDTTRDTISGIKQLMIKWNDAPFHMTCRMIYSLVDSFEEYGINEKDYIIFVHCREPHEIEKFRKAMDIVSLVVRRPSNKVYTNMSDRVAASEKIYNYNYVVNNDGDLEQLKEKAKKFIDIITK